MTSEPQLIGTPAHRGALATRIGEIALATPGVLRLEPSVRAVLVGLHPAADDRWRSRAWTARGPDGVIVTHVDGRVEVSVELATASGHPAVEVAIAVRQQVLVALAAARIPLGRIDVSVLAVGDG